MALLGQGPNTKRSVKMYKICDAGISKGHVLPKD